MSLTLEQLTRFRTLTIIALFSDDDLMDTLVLKGGNALEIGYGLSSRASIDLDFSLAQEFQVIGLENKEQIEEKLDKVLNKTFQDEGYKVFDVRVKVKPKRVNSNTADFWGGYEANFKLIELDRYEQYHDNPIRLAAKAIEVNESKKNITIDFGRFEYCGSVQMVDIDDYLIPIYTPQLIVFEKIRALCQQMEEYLITIGKDASFGGPRPRDFYDIHTVLEHESIPKLNFNDPENVEHLKRCFEAKRVSLDLIDKLKDTREFHRQGESQLLDTVLNKQDFKGFDFYFDYVIGVLASLKIPAA